MVAKRSKKTFILILFLSLSFFSLSFGNKIPQKNEEEKLIFVWEHYHHGERNPLAQVNKTTLKDFIGVKWKNIRELSSLGLRAQYLLGMANKNKYMNFLSKSFDANEIQMLIVLFYQH